MLNCFSFFLFFRSTTLLSNHTGLKTKLVGEHSIYPPFAEQVSDVHDCAACDASIDIHHFFSMSCYVLLRSCDCWWWCVGKNWNKCKGEKEKVLTTNGTKGHEAFFFLV